jgi:hypothetical protein
MYVYDFGPGTLWLSFSSVALGLKACQGNVWLLSGLLLLLVLVLYLSLGTGRPTSLIW